ncbi:MAG: hypothetical protein VXW65_00695, partial [Pseudomonadota bacterium]|nr:hypothetical protein [Pseudomonadota bacterium]
SGLLHLWQKTPHPSPSPAVFAVDQLSHQGWQAATQHPIKRLDLVAFDRHGSDSQPAWLVRPLTSIAVGAMTADKHEHQHHAAHQAGDIPDFRLFVAESGVELPDGVQQQAKNLARFYANLSTDQIGETQWVTRFSGEYGFINKRLPVLKVNTTQADGLRLYIEPSTGALAAQVTDWDAFEGTVFGYLHKWNMLPLPKLLRDAMLGLMAGLFGLVVLLGCSMAYFRLRHRQK